jgi:hypothetical protein
MNLVVVKYCLLIGAILASTAVVTGPLNPQVLLSSPESGQIAADSIYQFGSDAFYKEINSSGNEYMKTSTEGYSHALIPTDDMEATFQERWSEGVRLFRSGYKGSSGTVFSLAGIPQMTGKDEKVAVCSNLRASRNEMVRSLDYFTAARASATPGSSQGFTIGMVIPRIEQINAEAEDVEIACMQAVLADENNDPDGFSRNLKDADSHVRGMRRIYPELVVVSNDFNED